MVELGRVFLCGVLLMMGLSPGAVYADDPYELICGSYYRHESYSLGLGNEFADETQQPVYMDETCYRLGRSSGRRLREKYSGYRRSCDGAYEEGRRQGLRAVSNVARLPLDCFNAGYNVGVSLLANYARLGRADRVGHICVGAYEKGYDDASAGRAALPGSPDNRPRTCYTFGYDDAVITGGQ